MTALRLLLPVLLALALWQGAVTLLAMPPFILPDPLRVARTLADLDGADGVSRVHVAEALGYRAGTG